MRFREEFAYVNYVLRVQSRHVNGRRGGEDFLLALFAWANFTHELSRACGVSGDVWGNGRRMRKRFVVVCIGETR